MSEIEVFVEKADGEKCERCLRYTVDVGSHMYWPSHRICTRCVGVLLEIKWPPHAVIDGKVVTFRDEINWGRWKSGLDYETYKREA